MKKIWRILYNLVLSLIIFFSILIILSTLNMGGKRIFVVKSGSMEPKIHTGSIVIDLKQNTYVTGDVITFLIKNSKDTVTHRIVEVQNVGYKVRGDANNAPDPDLVPKGNVVGRVIFSVPLLGYLIAFVKTVPGLIIFIVIPATIIVYEEIGKIKEEIKKIRAQEKKLVAEERKFALWCKKRLTSLKNWMRNNTEAAAKKEAEDEKKN